MKKFCLSQVYIHSGILPSDIAHFLPSHEQKASDDIRTDDNEVLRYISILPTTIYQFIRFVSKSKFS